MMDSELLRYAGTEDVSLDSGVSVRIQRFTFRNDENPPDCLLVKPKFKDCLSVGNPVPEFFDVGYFYCPYLPVMKENVML